MKLLIAAIAFAATLGVLFLIETGKSPKEDSARILEALQEENTGAAVSTIPTPVKTSKQASPSLQNSPISQSKTPTPTRTPTPVPTPSHTPSRTPTPTPTHTSTPTPIPTRTPTPTSPSPTPTPAPTPTEALTPTFTPTPEPITPTPTPIPANHIFYTSSRSNSTKYYCDTDSGWKDLSLTYLKQFNSEAELLAVYPGKTLNKACK